MCTENMHVLDKLPSGMDYNAVGRAVGVHAPRVHIKHSIFK